jgi:hypothetical protein
MTTASNEKPAISGFKYKCINCDYMTSKKSSYNEHLHTIKHNRNNLSTFSNNETGTIIFKCDNCDKIYKDRTGLWRHKKKCIILEEPIPPPKEEPTDKEIIMMLLKEHVKKPDDTPDKDLIMLLIKENSELKNMMMEVIKNGTNNTTNSHNKAFNLNFFLNETCKDAMNITEFVNSIQLQLSDLERMGEVGYVEGLTSIISRNLKALDVNMRPVHCTDKKREIMYIKDETKWEKDEENVKMHKMIKNVAFENQRQILKYKEIHPDCGKSSSKYSDPYNKILVECMGGAGDNDFEKEEKIISKISKCVFVEKDPSV